MTDLQKEKITELRKNGESISSIAEKMNLSVNSVKSFCRRKDVSPMKDGCKRCGQPLVNTPGHRQKTFCSASCRQKYWRENSSLNWCRRKSKDEKGSARNTAAAPFSQRKSSAPAVEGSSARKCGIAQANTGELSGSAITNFPSLPETKSVKRHIFMRTR